MCWPNSSGSPTISSSCRAGASRWPARSTTCSPLTACSPARPAKPAGARERLNVVHARRGEAQAHLLVRTNGATDPLPQGFEAHPVSLEELTLAYLREPGAAALPGPARTGDAAALGGDAVTTQTHARARAESERQPAASALAEDGLGHLAPAPARARRCRRGVRRGRRVPADHRPADAQRLCHRDRLPPGELERLPAARPELPGQLRARRLGHRRPDAGDSGAGRSVRRRAAAGARVRDRHLPLRLDPGLRADRWTIAKLAPLAIAVTRRGRRVRRPLLLVLPADRRRGRRRQRPAESHDLRPPRRCRSPPGPWPRSRSAPWPAS